jgi:hypothetical protein
MLPWRVIDPSAAVPHLLYCLEVVHEHTQQPKLVSKANQQLHAYTQVHMSVRYPAASNVAVQIQHAVYVMACQELPK